MSKANMIDSRDEWVFEVTIKPPDSFCSGVPLNGMACFPGRSSAQEVEAKWQEFAADLLASLVARLADPGGALPDPKITAIIMVAA